MGNQWHLFFRVHVYVNTLHDESKPKAHYKYIWGGVTREKVLWGYRGRALAQRGRIFGSLLYILDHNIILTYAVEQHGTKRYFSQIKDVESNL